MPDLIVGNKLKLDKIRSLIEKATKKGGLLPGEEVYCAVTCSQFKPLVNYVFATNARLLGVGSVGSVDWALPYQNLVSLVPDTAKGTLEVTDAAKTTIFKIKGDDLTTLVTAVNQYREVAAPAELASALEGQAEQAERTEQAARGEWPNTKVIGKLSSKASLAILRQCHEQEEPWLILVSGGGAGLLAAFSDRLVIIKTGALTSFMAGSLGGERSAVFYFRDITGLEYNSGFASGVLEVLTPSYQGTANHDFWRGTNQSRNANSGDPWTLSNTLPLNKVEYNAALTQINDLRARISKAKEVVVVTASAPGGNSMAEELKKLAELRDSGVLSDEEFSAAKMHLIAG